MQTTILGISAFYHDSAAALIKNGNIIAAAQEERFTRKKFDPRFPINAINYCLEEAFIEMDEIDAIAFYDIPFLTLDRVLQSIISNSPSSVQQWNKAAKSILGVKMFIKDHIKEALKTDVPVYFVKHHTSHAASAFYPSPFDEAACLTIDGVGEWDTTTISKANSKGIQTLKSIEFPHSLGLLYSAFTYFTGFKVNSGEYKMMGLAPYGQPTYADVIKDKLIEIYDDGSFKLNMEYFGYMYSDKMINNKFCDLFNGTERQPDNRITRREIDISASIQKVTEEVIVKLAKHANKITGSKNLVMAGGVALNCVANGKLLPENIFENIWIQPAAGDAGGALGAALLLYHEKFNPNQNNKKERDIMKGSLLGPSFSNDEIKAFLEKESLKYHFIESKDDINKIIAEHLSNGKVVGYFNGRMEYGPRALGSRSILGDPRNADTQVNMNLKIKYRESFRPFAPSVMHDKSSEYFNISCESPYMLLVANINKSLQQPFEMPDITNEQIDLLEIVKQKRSNIPAITHVDYSARIQSVNPIDNKDYYEVIKEFQKLTGYGVIVNTSFNVRGEPIVCTPQDAYNCFQNTEMDVLVLENFILYKNEQPEKDKSELQDLLAEDSNTAQKDGHIDNDQLKKIEKFYTKHICKTPAQVQQRLKNKLLIEQTVSSNYNEPRFTENYVLADSLNEFNELSKLWEKEGIEELNALLKPLHKLASELKQKEYVEEVSPYIYAMY